jgi:FAD synthetase
MTIIDLVDRYIKSVEDVFQQISLNKKVLDEKALKILGYAKRYFEDAEYYRDQKKFETALISISYCEGLLDALRILEIVKFQWSKDKK